MPQLETLMFGFLFPVPNCDEERQLSHMPITAHVALPITRTLSFRGASTYIEAVVCQITTPHLELLELFFSHQLTFSIPRLLLLMSTIENLEFSSANVLFSVMRRPGYISFAYLYVGASHS
jgi:hypothetical protein